MESRSKEHHLKVTRCVLMAQLFLESLDDIKTTAYYKQDVRNLTNNLEKKLEGFLSKPNEYLIEGEAEQVMMKLGRGFEKLTNLTLDEIYENDPLG
jgi:hypothetical protein